MGGKPNVPNQDIEIYTDGSGIADEYGSGWISYDGPASASGPISMEEYNLGDAVAARWSIGQHACLRARGDGVRSPAGATQSLANCIW